MKTVIIKISFALMLVVCSKSSYAQCNKNFILEANKTDFMDTAGRVTRSQEKPVDISLKDSVLTIQFGDNRDQVLTGKINKSVCTYKTPFKEGKMVIFADLSNPAGIHQTATLKLSTNAGNTTITYTSLERPNIRIQLSADKFEELKN
ncbi:hypothetical protein [Pedobacter steynii]